MKLLLIQNPVAGRNRKKTSVQDVLSLFAQSHVELTHRVTGQSGDCAAYARDADASYDAIVCMGGDGTLHEAVSGILERPDDLPVGFIPYGTTNDLAYSLALPEDPIAAGRMIISGHSRRMDIGAFGERFFVYVASFGTFSDVVFWTPQSRKNRFGKMAYILTGALSLRRIRAHRAVIEHDHGTESGEFALVAMTNARRTAGGFIRYGPEEAAMDDGLFELMLVKKPRNLLMTLLVLTRMALNRQDDRYIRRVQTARARVSSDTPIPWCLDGEYGGSLKEVEIRVQPRRISVIQG
ncbi:diacylglycerol kinase family lipid kinase [Eubacteriales bacterium OttesenSCG-928-A19]|nr:diacylglycerol kinase family lipid kinase [Eubacteriales bacterium OttesenSCG-928-A19]